MNKRKLGSLSFICLQSLFTCSINFAAPANPAYNWSGFYIGGTAGADSSRFDMHTVAQPGSLLDPIQANAVNYAGNQKMNASGFLAGIEGGYNWQRSGLLLGLEADIESLDINTNTNSGAIPYPNRPERQFVLTVYGNNNWLSTIRPRLGFIKNNWLFYATGGLGITYLQSDFLFSNNANSFESSRVNKLKAGYVLGAGAEAGLTKQVSLKAEYLFTNFGNTNAYGMHHARPGQTFANVVNLKSNILRIGVNYRFDNQALDLSESALNPLWFDTSEWQIDIGTRLFLSTGIDGAPQPLFANGNIPLYSRLTFSDLTAVSEDIIARADHTSGLFVKGYLGAGTIIDGQLNDEDFPAGGAYSNTLSDVSGNLAYATADVGYSFLKTPSAKTGVFVGYNYYTQNLNAYNCKQLAGAPICGASSGFTNFLGISEDDRFNSLRVGLSTQFDLTNRLTLNAEAAYLPVISFRGTDNHNARQLIIPERASYGDGSMLESVLEYQFSDFWNVGLGGRYWMWNTHSGAVTFNFLGENGAFNQPAHYHTERYGVFLQLSYRDKKILDAASFDTPINWRGIYIGAHLGGAWGKSYWSDPFAATWNPNNLINAAGFGDKIRSTGPLGGVDLDIMGQIQQLIYGIGATLNGADLRGENTLFSGIGGVNGETVANYLGTIVAKVGMTFNQSVLYLNAGPALLNTQYKINANTGVLNLGSETNDINAWGWTTGLGVEYAVTNHWSTNIEYDYVRIPNRHPSFPSIALINEQRISVDQTMNVFKAGVKYRFDI